MKKLVILLVLALMVGLAYGAEIAGVHFEDGISVADQKLILNGTGLRKKMLVKVYVAGLYLKEKSSDALSIIEADQPMAIILKFIYDEVPAEKLIETWKEGFEKSTKKDTSKLQREIEEFNSIFNAPAKKGDTYEFIYLPTKETVVRINNSEKRKISGLPFKKALFGIWLCDDPADRSLKEGLLGTK